MEVIGDVDQSGRLHRNVSRNDSIPEHFKWKKICNKCQNKIVKGAGINLRICLCRAWAIPSITDGVARRLLRQTSEG